MSMTATKEEMIKRQCNQIGYLEMKNNFYEECIEAWKKLVTGPIETLMSTRNKMLMEIVNKETSETKE